MRLAAVAWLLSAAVSAQEAPGQGWVVLPIDEYKLLHQQAHPAEPTPAALPADVVVSRLEYDVRVTGGLAVGTARLTLDVLKDGWVSVALPAPLNVSAVRVDGRPVARVRAAEGGGAPQVLLSQAGRAVLTMDVALPVASGAGTETLTLPPAGSAVSHAIVVVPKDGIDVTVGGGLLAEASDGGRQSRWVAYGEGRAALVFSWRRKVEERRAALPLRFRGAIVQMVALGEESTQITADVRLDIVQGEAAKIEIAVPEGVSINRVSGQNVADWEVKAGTLEIHFLDAVKASESFVVAGETRSPREGRVDVPLLRLPQAERETGGIGVEVMGSGEVTSGEARGLDDADAADLAPTVAGRAWGIASAYRFRAQDGRSPRTLAVTLSRYLPQAVLMAAVEEAWYDALLTEEGKALIRARYAVRNNTQSFLVVTLPEAATLWSAAVSGRPVRPGRSREGSFLLPLEKSEAGEDAPAFLVELVYFEKGAAWALEGVTSLRFPAVDLPVSRTGVQLHYPPGHRVSLLPGVFRAQPYRAPFSRAFAGGARPVRAAAATGDDNVQGLLERLKKAGGGTRGPRGLSPIQVPFPAYGDAAFLATELTKEGDAPTLELRYKRSKKGGWQ